MRLANVFRLFLAATVIALSAGCDSPAPSMKGQPAPKQMPGPNDKKAQ